MNNDRNAIFISHANPEDNDFTMWLGARLVSAGYEVWADILRLRGGQDWQRILEDALRKKACKVLLVGTSVAVAKQGVRNEIQIAHDVSRKIKDAEFIIPLRLENFDAPFLIAHAQYIDFKRSWSKGLAELTDTLENTYSVPRNPAGASVIEQYWRGVHLRHAAAIEKAPETLLSNWLQIKKLPDELLFYDFKAGIALGKAQAAVRAAPLPLAPFKRGFIGFAPLHDMQEAFGPELPLSIVDRFDTIEAFEKGWYSQKIDRWEVEKHVSNLIRQALNRFMAGRGLSGYEMAGDALAWWAPVSRIPTEKIPYAWSVDLKGRRQVTGRSEKRGFYWHYGLTVKPRFFPMPHVKLLSRLIFTEDGEEPFDNVKKMHRLRRSFARGWFNSKWRDMMLAFLHWLSEGEERLLLPVGSQLSIELALPPVSATAPVSIVGRESGEGDDLDEEPDEPEGDDSGEFYGDDFEQLEGEGDEDDNSD